MNKSQLQSTPCNSTCRKRTKLISNLYIFILLVRNVKCVNVLLPRNLSINCHSMLYFVHCKSRVNAAILISVNIWHSTETSVSEKANKHNVLLNRTFKFLTVSYLISYRKTCTLSINNKRPRLT